MRTTTLFALFCAVLPAALAAPEPAGVIPMHKHTTSKDDHKGSKNRRHEDVAVDQVETPTTEVDPAAPLDIGGPGPRKITLVGSSVSATITGTDDGDHWTVKAAGQPGPDMNPAFNKVWTDDDFNKNHVKSFNVKFDDVATALACTLTYDPQKNKAKENVYAKLYNAKDYSLDPDAAPIWLAVTPENPAASVKCHDV